MGPQWDHGWIVVLWLVHLSALHWRRPTVRNLSVALDPLCLSGGAGGNLALLKTSDRVRIDLRTREANALVL